MGTKTAGIVFIVSNWKVRNISICLLPLLLLRLILLLLLVMESLNSDLENEGKGNESEKGEVGVKEEKRERGTTKNCIL